MEPLHDGGSRYVCVCERERVCVCVCVLKYMFVNVWVRGGGGGSRPRTETSPSNRHELLVCWRVSIIIALNVQQMRIDLHDCFTSLIVPYGVATISRMLKNIGLFCKRALQKRPVFCKETCIFKHPTHRSHPIANQFQKRTRTKS